MEDPLILGTLWVDWEGSFLVLRELRGGEFDLSLSSEEEERTTTRRVSSTSSFFPRRSFRYVTFSFSFSARPAQPTPALEDQPTEGISTQAEMGSSTSTSSTSAPTTEGTEGRLIRELRSLGLAKSPRPGEHSLLEGKRDSYIDSVNVWFW
ncbi:hypothetical protein BDY24DRAFT_399060 [Mrakia frigida]|uniref:uncharacterized protein n=1 Tax=Mrakia frigida TaxID=29902 RepID=UPI003FCC1CB6